MARKTVGIILMRIQLFVKVCAHSRVTKRQTAHSTVQGLGNFLALDP